MAKKDKQENLDGQFVKINGRMYSLIKLDGYTHNCKPIFTMEAVVEKVKRKKVK